MYDIDNNYDNETEEMQDIILEQIFIESKFMEEATSKYENSISRMATAGLFSNTSEGSILQKMTVQAVADQIKEYFSSTIRGTNASYRAFLKDSFEGREEVLSFIVIQHLLNAVATRTPKLTALSISLTNDVLNLISVEDFKNNQPKFYAYLEYEYKSRGIGYINSRKKKLARMDSNSEAKASAFKVHIGTRLIDIVLKSGCNLFEKRTQYSGTKRQGTLGITEDAMKIIGKVKDRNVLFSVTYKPLIAPPIPWDNIYGDGGYYTSNSLQFIRNNKASKHISNNMADLDISRMYSVINNIQDTKWKINSYVLEVVEKIIEDSMVDPTTPTGNPKFYGNIPYMDTLNVYDMVKRETYGELNDKGMHIEKDAYKRWFKDKEIQLKKLEAIRSKRIMFLLAYNLANEYRERDEMYFTYNCDFRGRLYPIQQILNPQSTGAVKAFLEFAEAKPLSTSGLHWLKVHIANNYGLDKSSFDDRVLWVDNNMDEILRIANEPMATVELWNEADEPLMYLAGCKALLDHTEGKPVSLPVSLDATCSGLQLYSGLLKDKEGAEAVNVIDRSDKGASVKPADVYTDVAIVVEGYLEAGDYPTKLSFTTRDGERKTESTIKEANDLQGNVTRKLTKRNIMTTPYSVTKRGMYDQVRELLDEMESDDKVFWRGDKWIVAKLLVELNSKAISEVVSGASNGQLFIKDIVFSYYQDKTEAPLIWTTPFFNFPVVQWKVRNKEQRIKTCLGNLALRAPTTKINKQQMYNGIAPNFVHSLDATLLYLTAEKMVEQGVSSFMFIHDSFGVPANDVHKLNTAVREAFVELFEAEPLKTWVEQIEPTRVNEVAGIMIDTLDLEEVRKSTYIFS